MKGRTTKGKEYKKKKQRKEEGKKETKMKEIKREGKLTGRLNSTPEVVKEILIIKEEKRKRLKAKKKVKRIGFRILQSVFVIDVITSKQNRKKNMATHVAGGVGNSRDSKTFG